MAASKVETGERVQAQRKHIFAVNGSPDFLDMLRELLQGEDYNVTTTNFVPKTFDQIEALEPNLLIIDLVVGQRAGTELLSRLTSESATRHIPVVLVSTSRYVLDEVECGPQRDGAIRYLTKPFDLDDLLNSVDEMIGPA